MNHLDRRDLLRLLPAGALAAWAGSQSPPAEPPPHGGGTDAEAAKSLRRDRERTNEQYLRLLGVGHEAAGKGGLLGWQALEFPDPALAGLPEGDLQKSEAEAGGEQWRALAKATGSVTGRAAHRWLRRLPGLAWLEGPAAPPCPPPVLRPIVEHRNMEIHPSLLPVLRGTTVDFVNRDACRDNIMSESATARFSHWFTGADQVESHTFDRAGVAPLLCKVHPDEWGTVLVLETPFFALVPAAGSFVIPNVPPGRWELCFWHPKLRPARLAVEVRAGAPCPAVLKDLQSL